jgi:hypothetical protein
VPILFFNAKKDDAAKVRGQFIGRPLERLSDESAGELPGDIPSTNVLPFARRVPG